MKKIIENKKPCFSLKKKNLKKHIKNGNGNDFGVIMLPSRSTSSESSSLSISSISGGGAVGLSWLALSNMKLACFMIFFFLRLIDHFFIHHARGSLMKKRGKCP